ncbi:MAG: aspartate aminotransferase family protein [Anaerolineales bacterium]|nr:aspartate aminotransferase family protein [Anaerolineales bacterium]
MLPSLLQSTLTRALRYRAALPTRRVSPDPDAIRALTGLDEPLPQHPTDPETILAQLDELGSPATVTSAGGRYFGFVTGSDLPAALAANWLAAAWDQNAALGVMSPIAAKLEELSTRWLVDLLGFPPETVAGFVTGATMANFTCLAAARHALLEKHGWNVETQGLFGAPEIKVVVGEEVHASLLKALGMLGLGRERVIRVPVDDQGRMRADFLPLLDDRTLVCIQAGNVNTGAFDPAQEICEQAHKAGAWIHVDGAFGLWALACPPRAHLARGVPDADSWAVDAHKWLNVPYDSGIAFCRHPDALRAAMTVLAPYLLPTARPEPSHFTPEMSRRARGIEIWAALKSLGRTGLAELIEHNCQLATRFADGLRARGHTVLNEVVLNQVLVSFGDAETTTRIITELQAEGTFWAGSTVWQGHTAMRISVSSWATTEADVDRCLEVVERYTRI